MSAPALSSSSSSSAAAEPAGPGSGVAGPAASDVYDRQIRLWGAEAQKKMQEARVLYVHVTGTTAEVLKNLVLAGVSATLCDVRPAAATLGPNPCFFSPPSSTAAGGAATASSSVADAVRPMVEELNPLLGPCPVLAKAPADLTEDDVAGYTVVIASQIPLAEAIRLSEMVVGGDGDRPGRAFYLADCFGMRGAALFDLGRACRYRPEQGKALLDPVGLADYVPLAEAAGVPLGRATGRFHPRPPPTWVLYRCLLEYQGRTGRWLGDDGVDPDHARAVLGDFLKEQDAKLPDDEGGAALLDSLITAGMAQVAPVCAVMGGVLGNEIIKVISGKGEPANNTLLLDGAACKVWTFLVKDSTLSR